jgi:SAM-dependent methyltransferase
MYTDGSYLQKNPDWNEQDAVYKARWIKELLNGKNIHPKTIVEVGCGSGRVLVELSALLGNHIIFRGYDISPQAIDKASGYTSANIHFELADYLGSGHSAADTILLLDVIEHVEDYYGFLQKLKSKGETFIFHIPLDLSCRTLVKSHVLLQQRNAAGHIHYFSRDMVLWMLADTGYIVVDWMYTKPVPDFVTVKGFKPSLKKMLRNFSFSISQDFSADWWGGYSMMVLAK